MQQAAGSDQHIAIDTPKAPSPSTVILSPHSSLRLDSSGALDCDLKLGCSVGIGTSASGGAEVGFEGVSRRTADDIPGGTHSPPPVASMSGGSKNGGMWIKKETTEGRVKRLHDNSAAAVVEGNRVESSGQTIGSPSSRTGLELEPEALIFKDSQLCILRSATVTVKNR